MMTQRVVLAEGQLRSVAGRRGVEVLDCRSAQVRHEVRESRAAALIQCAVVSKCCATTLATVVGRRSPSACPDAVGRHVCSALMAARYAIARASPPYRARFVLRFPARTSTEIVAVIDCAPRGESGAPGVRASMSPAARCGASGMSERSSKRHGRVEAALLGTCSSSWAVTLQQSRG